MRICFRLCVILLLALLTRFGQASTEPTKLAQLRGAYQEELAVLEAPIEKLNENYRNALERLLDKRAEAGDLEKVLVVKEELTALEGDNALAAGSVASRLSKDTELGAVQRTYLRTRERFDADSAAKRGKLVDAYRNQLEALEKELTKNQRIDEAILVKVERDSLSAPAMDSESATSSFRGRIHLVGKGEVEVFVNGKEVRYRNESDNPQYVDMTSSPLEIAVGDVIGLRLRGDAVFRGAILGITSTDGARHVSFPASSFRLLGVGDEVDLAKLSSAQEVKESVATVQKSQPDGEMRSFWGPHGIKHCQFIQSPAKGEWAVFGAVVEGDRISVMNP